MAKQVINRGTVAGDGTGESPFSGMGKANDNFTELYSLGAAQDVSIAAAATAAAAAQTTADSKVTSAQAAAAAPVQSVAGKAGAVGLVPADVVGFNTAAAAAAPVQTVNGLSGAVVVTSIVTNYAALPITGTVGVTYIASDTGYAYRWTGAAYIDFTFTAGTPCESYGASPSASASVNTAAIQAALDGRGTVTLTTPGVYNITSGGVGTEILRIHSNTHFYLGAGVTIMGPAAGTTALPLITNSNWRSNRVNITSITATTSTAPYVTTAAVDAAGHSYAVGDYVLVKGDTSGYYNGIWKVDSIIAGMSFTFAMVSFSVAPPNGSGTMICYAADAHFSISGKGNFNHNLNTSTVAGRSWGSFNSIFNKVSDYSVSCSFVNSAKYGIAYCNSWRSKFSPGSFLHPSDGIHGCGPISQCTIRDVFGSTGDDLVAFTADNIGYTAYDFTDADGTKNSDGDITDVTIENIQAFDSVRILLATGNGLNIKRVTYRDIKRNSNLSGATFLIDNSVASVGSLEDIIIDGLHGNAQTNVPLISIGQSVGTINIKNLTLRNIGSHGGAVSGTPYAMTNSVLSTQNAATVVTIDGLLVDGVHAALDLANASGAIKLFSMGAAGGSVWTTNNIKINNVVVTGTGNLRSASLLGLYGLFDDVSLSNCQISCAQSSLISESSAQAGTGRIKISNCSANGDGTNNGQSIVNLGGNRNIDLQLSNVTGSAALNGGVQILAGSLKSYDLRFSNVKLSHKSVVNFGTSHTFNIYEGGLSSINNTKQSGTMIAIGTTSTWNFEGSCADIGIDASVIARRDGTIIYNTNAALGTLGVAGLVAGQGVAAGSWHLMSDPTKFY